MKVLHIDGDEKNCHLDNLVYVPAYRRNDASIPVFKEYDNIEYDFEQFDINSKLLKENDNFLIHRIVAFTFLEKINIPDKEVVVNHKDENKENNKLENLEFCSQQENTRLSTQKGITVYMSQNDSSEIRKFSNKREAARWLYEQCSGFKNVNSAIRVIRKYTDSQDAIKGFYFYTMY